MAACGTRPPSVLPPQTVVQNKYFFVKPDESLRHCKEGPPKPDLRDSIGVAIIITDLKEVLDDCRSKLGATWKSIDEVAKQADQLNKDSVPK